MKKILSAVVLCGFVGLGLTGCAGETKTGTKSTTSVTKPDGSTTTETKKDEKAVTPPSK